MMGRRGEVPGERASAPPVEWIRSSGRKTKSNAEVAEGSREEEERRENGGGMGDEWAIRARSAGFFSFLVPSARCLVPLFEHLLR